MTFLPNSWRSSRSLIFPTIVIIFLVPLAENGKAEGKDSSKPFIDMSLDFEAMKREIRLKDQVNFSSTLNLTKPAFNHTECSRLFLHAQAQILSRLHARFQSKLRRSDSKAVTITLTHDEVSRLKKYSTSIEKLAQEGGETLEQKCRSHGEMISEFEHYFDELYIAAQGVDDSGSSLQDLKEALFIFSQLWVPALFFVCFLAYGIIYRPSFGRSLFLLLVLLVVLYVLSILQYFWLLHAQFVERESTACGLKHRPPVGWSEWASSWLSGSSVKPDIAETPEQIACIERNVSWKQFMGTFNVIEFLINHWGKTVLGPTVGLFFNSIQGTVAGLLGDGFTGRMLATVFTLGSVVLALYLLLNPVNFINAFTAMIHLGMAVRRAAQEQQNAPILGQQNARIAHQQIPRIQNPHNRHRTTHSRHRDIPYRRRNKYILPAS